MKNNLPIGVFDSGVGGLTVFKNLIQKLPNESYIYFGDTKNLPYGTKSKSELIVIAKKIFDFFKLKNTKAVIMACNTTSALVYDELKDNYDFKIYPIIQTGTKSVVAVDNKRIGVMATCATAKSGAYKKAIKDINPEIMVKELGCLEFVDIVENKDMHAPENTTIIKKYVDEMLEFKPEKIILGCTHYPYLLDVLTKFAPKEIFVDPGEYFANYIIDDLKTSHTLSDNPKPSREFYVSDAPQKFMQAAKIFYTPEKTPMQINLS